MLMDMCLPKFDIYRCTVDPDCFKSHTTSSCLDLFQKIFLSIARPEIHFMQCNPVSAEYSVRI